MSLPEHWLDEICGNAQDSDELLQLLLNAPEMQEIASKALDVGEEQQKALEQNPKLCGLSVAQAIRQEFLRRINAESKQEALA